MAVLRWAKVYSGSFGRTKIEEYDILKALVMVPDSVASAVIDAVGLSEAVRTHFNLKPLGIPVQTLSDEDLGLRGYGSIVYAQTYADESGSGTINTGHLLLAVTVLCVTVIPYSDGVEERQKQTVRTICRLVRDVTPRHKEIAETDDLQIHQRSDAQRRVEPQPPADMRKPQMEEPAPPLVPVEQFRGMLLVLAHKNPGGLEPTERDLLVAALEARDPHVLAFSQGQVTCVLRLLGLNDARRYAGLIRRLAEPCVSAQTVQVHYDSISDVAEDGPLSERRIIGTLLQVLNGGEPVRKMGPPTDYLTAGDGGTSQDTTTIPLSMHGM